jgi:drug/metabolite transporter (DMT)-like permease
LRAVSRRGWLLFAAMGVIWGIPYLLIKVAVGALSPVSLVFLRTAAASLLLLPLALTRGDLRALAKHWRALLAYTAVEIGLPWLLLSDAEVRLSSSVAGLLVATTPLISALLALVTRASDRMNVAQVAGLVVGFGGVAAVVGLDFSRGDPRAYTEMVVVAVCYAAGPMIMVRRLASLPALGIVTASLCLTAIAYAPAGVAQLPAHLPSWQVLTAVGVLAVVCTATAFLLFFALIRETGPVRAMLITYLNPAVALALGMALLHEPFTAGAGVGFVLILAGSYMATRRPGVNAPARESSSGPEAERVLAASR